MDGSLRHGPCLLCRSSVELPSIKTGSVVLFKGLTKTFIDFTPLVLLPVVQAQHFIFLYNPTQPLHGTYPVSTIPVPSVESYIAFFTHYPPIGPRGTCTTLDPSGQPRRGRRTSLQFTSSIFNVSRHTERTLFIL